MWLSHRKSGNQVITRFFFAEIEKLQEIHGLKYVSKPRSKTLKGRYHGGAAHIVNIENFSLETLADVVPKSLKVMWGII